ncbi:MAG: hypothetical protein ACK5IB_03565 [Qingshengfaniella sp.]
MYPQNSVYVSEAAYQALSPEDQAIVAQTAQDAATILPRWSWINRPRTARRWRNPA